MYNNQKRASERSRRKRDVSEEKKPLPLAKVTAKLSQYLMDCLPGQSGGLTVDGDTLFYLFNREELRGNPLSIVSIAGATRSGKSFILTFFLRYLRNEGWKNPDWFGDEKTAVDQNFLWERGMLACTKGIDVWPEIFHVPLSNGRKCAVLIVDTQGLFDRDTSSDTNAKLMSLSTIFSSHQILNLNKQIEERDLEHLEMCVEVAKQSAEWKNCKNEKAFQSLMFLIRDWEQDDNLGNGTDCYLRKYLEKPSQSQDVNKVKQSIRSAFDTVRCFLLPHPEKKVIRADNVSLRNEDVDDDFIQHTKELVESILHPDNIVIKKTRDGKEATADDLRNLLGCVGKNFSSGKMPKVETTLESIIRATNTKLVSDAISAYKNTMKRLIGDKIVRDSALIEYHRQALQKALIKFKSEAQMGDEKSRKVYVDQLCKECGDKFDSIKKENSLLQVFKLESWFMN